MPVTSDTALATDIAADAITDAAFSANSSTAILILHHGCMPLWARSQLLEMMLILLKRI